MELPASRTGRSAEQVALECSRIAGDIICERFQALRSGTPIERTTKGRGNYVTETDLAVESAVIALLRDEYPDHRVLSEETSAEVPDWQRGWLWVMDPVDGTSNFSRGIPTFAFNLALCFDGEPVLGITHQPVTGDQFFAVQGGGLLVNGAPAVVSPVAALADSLLGMGLGYQYDRAKLLLGLLHDVWPRVQMIQNIGAAAIGMAYAASGRFDLYVHSNVLPWDVAPGFIQIREAGGLVLDREGGRATIYSEGLIAGAPGPVREFLEISRGRVWR